MKKAQRISWERSYNSLKLKVTTIPAMIWSNKNSCGKGTISEQISTTIKCVNSAVRESKKVRTTMGTIAYGRIYMLNNLYVTHNSVKMQLTKTHKMRKKAFRLFCRIFLRNDHRYNQKQKIRPNTRMNCPARIILCR